MTFEKKTGKKKERERLKEVFGMIKREEVNREMAREVVRLNETEH